MEISFKHDLVLPFGIIKIAFRIINALSDICQLLSITSTMLKIVVMLKAIDFRLQGVKDEFDFSYFIFFGLTDRLRT